MPGLQFKCKELWIFGMFGCTLCCELETSFKSYWEDIAMLYKETAFQAKWIVQKQAKAFPAIQRIQHASRIKTWNSNQSPTFFFLLKYASEQQRAIDTKGHFREGEHFQKAYNVEDDRSIKITVNFNKTLQIWATWERFHTGCFHLGGSLCTFVDELLGEEQKEL